MNDVTLLSHFSVPRWPLVNRLYGIARCLNIPTSHCATIEKLQSSLKTIVTSRVLLLLDEVSIGYLPWLHQEKWPFDLEIALFIESKISKVAYQMSKLPKVKYMFEFDGADSFGGRHLAVLLKKFIEKDILNLNKYLGFGAVIQTKTINSSASKRDAIEKIHDFVSNLGETTYYHPFGQYARIVAEMTDELVINSIFGANPRMQNADRAADFNLSESEQVELSWGYDGECFGVSVRDPFGKFNLETIMEYISSQAKMENIVSSKSAGLGLKMIFDRTHQLITNVQRKKVTEVIAIVKFESRLLEFEKTKKSFFYFSDGEEEK